MQEWTSKVLDEGGQNVSLDGESLLTQEVFLLLGLHNCVEAKMKKPSTLRSGFLSLRSIAGLEKIA